MKVVIQPDMPRHMRREEIGNIQGLIDLYEFVKPRTVAEIGCYQGESSEIAAQFSTVLVCVDNWGKGFEGGEGGFDKRMKKFNHINKVKLTSKQASENFPNNLFDLVYIDAMHDFENVIADIKCWLPKVKKGGYIGGHDFDSNHPEVIEAVMKSLNKKKKYGKIKTFSDSSWLVKKK